MDLDSQFGPMKKALPTSIVNLLAQWPEICSSTTWPCDNGLICGAPDNEGTRRCPDGTTQSRR